jgi:oligopeptide/dipeptide ABC transporter ATP-binding protein
MREIIPLLKVHNLNVHFRDNSISLHNKKRVIKALNGINLEILPKETLGIVGESGCGKTTLGRTIMLLIHPTSGEIFFKGTNILHFRRKSLNGYRQQVQMVFQNPISSLNPRMRILDCLSEPLKAHTSLNQSAIKNRVSELLNLVGMEETHLDRFPHMISGGQAQRVAIARALALNPEFLVLDEPTSALDVSVQAQIINLLKDLQLRKDLTYLLISHDLAVVQYVSHRIAVMYLGEIVEFAPSIQIFGRALHPYTQALLSATPEPDPLLKKNRIVLQGSVPDSASLPDGCTFHPRCKYAAEQCRVEKPLLLTVGEEHFAACHAIVHPENFKLSGYFA